MNIKNKLAAVLTALACTASIMAVMPVIAGAEEFIDGALTYVSVDEDSDGVYDYAKVRGLNNSATEIEILPEVNGLPVKSIATNAFKGYSELTSVIIPDSITTIGDYAFAMCGSLTNITLPDSITSIGSYAFENCGNLADIIIPESVTHIASGAFSTCVNLTSIVIPESITRIETCTFSYCTNLESIEIPESVVSIGSGAFKETQWLIYKMIDNPLVIVNDILIDGTACEGDVIIPDGVKSIGEWAFSGCKDIYSVVIPDSVTTIGDGAFNYCTWLLDITIPESVVSIGAHAFKETRWLEEMHDESPFVVVNGILVEAKNCRDDVVIPDGVTSIGEYAFGGDKFLTGVTIPEGVVSIGSSAFSGCEGLVDVTISDSVTNIGSCAFISCLSLKEITIPESVTGIGKDAFSCCKSLESITILNPECEIYDTDQTISNGLVDVEGPFIIIEEFNYRFDGTIYGLTNSTAEEYAEKYGRNFVSIGEYIKVVTGDITGDSQLNLYDAIEIAKYIMDARDFTEAETETADYNGDGVVNLYDVIEIAKYMMN